MILLVAIVIPKKTMNDTFHRRRVNESESEEDTKSNIPGCSSWISSGLGRNPKGERLIIGERLARWGMESAT